MMLNIVNTRSVWTIDLVILLERLLYMDYTNNFPPTQTPTLEEEEYSETEKIQQQTKQQKVLNATYLFCSTKFGVDESYNGLCYYKSTFQQDEMRVTKRFALASQLSLPTLCLSSLSLDHVVNIVSRKKCVAIVLLDNRILLHQYYHYDDDDKKKKRKIKRNNKDGMNFGIRDNTSQNEVIQKQQQRTTSINDSTYDNTNDSEEDDDGIVGIDDEMSSSSMNSYAGHYVVLCGVSYDKDDITVAEIEERGYRSDFLEEPTTTTHDNGGGGESSSSPSLSKFCMVIKNPSSSNSTDFVTPAHFERAWRANGTDEDVIFVAKHTRLKKR